MPGSRRTAAVLLTLLLAATLFFALPAPRLAQAEIWKWRQTDWSGGSGQASFGGYDTKDPTRYSTSTNIDTKGTPGSLKLSYRYDPFIKAAANPVIALGPAGSWDEQAAIASDFRVLGTGYEAFCVGWGAGDIDGIGRATSPNGITWTKAAENPLIGAGSWNPNGSDPGQVIVENDIYKMWFEGRGGTGGFGYAESTDGIHWDLSPANPVFSPGAAGSWDERLDEIVAVVHDGSQYKMWYEGYAGGPPSNWDMQPAPTASSGRSPRPIRCSASELPAHGTRTILLSSIS